MKGGDEGSSLVSEWTYDSSITAQESPTAGHQPTEDAPPTENMQKESDSNSKPLACRDFSERTAVSLEPSEGKEGALPTRNAEEEEGTSVPPTEDDPLDSSTNSLLCGDFPDDLHIVSIYGLNEEEKSTEGEGSSSEQESRPLKRTNSANYVSSFQAATDDSKRDEERPPPLRAKSEPALHYSELPTTQKHGLHSILRHTVTTDSNDDKGPPRKVNFGTVDVRDYPIIPGDNPGGMAGVPLTIDWQHQGEAMATVDEYEEKHPKRRTHVEFIIPPDVRLRLLQKSGYPLTEIQRYTKKANIVRNQRKSTVDFSHMSGISEAKEKMSRGVSNMLKKGKKQKEQDYIHQRSTWKISNKHVPQSRLPVKKQGSSQLTMQDPLSSDEEVMA